jgi:hypothetical protein
LANPTSNTTNNPIVVTEPTNATPIVNNTPTPTSYNPTNNGNVNNQSPIIFSGSSTTNGIISQQQGDSAVYDAVTKFAAQNNNNLTKIQSILSTGLNFTLTATNGQVGTNVWVDNQLTNYSTEATLEGLTNLVGHFLNATNIGDTNSIAAQEQLGSVAALNGSNLITGTVSGLTVPSTDDGYGSDGVNWTISIPYGPGYSIDLNPFHVSWVNDLATFVRSLIAWIFTCGLYYRNWKLLNDQYRGQAATRQATTSGQTVLGNNANIASCIICAGLITTVMLALPIFASGWFGVVLPISHLANPFSGSLAGTVATSVWMVDKFFPLAFMVYCVFNGIIFQVSISAVVWVTNTLTRFIVGL